MSALSTLRAVDGAAASLCAEIRSLSRAHGPYGEVILLKDAPARYQAALLRQGENQLLHIDGEAALKLADVERWIEDVRHTFHLADSCESIPGITLWRRWSFGGLADGKLGKREVKFAQALSAEQGLTPLMALLGERLALPVPANPEQELLSAPSQARLPAPLVEKLTKDHEVESFEIWEAVEAVRNNTEGHSALSAFRAEHASAMTPDALTALDAYLELGEINAMTPVAHPSLARLWKETRKAWDLTAIEDPHQDISRESSKLSKPILQTTNAEGYRLATEVKAFFERYPSTGGRVSCSFFAGWAINATFGDMPLQAWHYTHAHPVDKDGKPRGPLWIAYATAVDTGAPRDVIEEAFFRATIADYKHAISAPEFKKLYISAPTSHRKAIDAHVHTLRAVEAELDLGTTPLDVAKRYPLAMTRELVKRGAWWFGFWGTLGMFFTNQHPKTAKQTAIAIDLKPAERKQLTQELRLGLPQGVSTINAKTISQATFSEPPRGAASTRPLPRYPLALSDFARRDPIHRNVGVSGVDGVFDKNEIEGVVRQAQARVRSNLIDAFDRKYPTPMNGLLVYTTNMLAL
ncbi:MAG: hypothetical protein H7Z43_13745, partial [Clostridia bacterium]|nr:hypothetical protein [Deltaproteobacteria bacterium]